MKFFEFFNKISKKTNEASTLKAWLITAGVAVCSLLFALLPFFVTGTYNAWSDGPADAVTQGITYLKHVENFGWLKTIGSYDFYIGLGADYLTSLSFFSLFDPYNVFFFILPFSDVANYTITMWLKHLTCALTMFAYLKYKKVDNFKATVLSVAYMLTGFVAFTFLRHYNLTAGPIYFPLIIMGIEKIFEGKRPFLLIASVFICLMTNFYVFVSVSIFAVAYAIAYYFYQCSLSGEKRSLKGFLTKLVPIGCFYLLAVALAGMMILPNAYAYLNAARSASKGLEFFDFTVFLTRGLSLTLPIAGQTYSAMQLNPALIVLALYAVFKKDHRYSIYRIFVVVLTIGYMIPLFGYIMNFFNYTNNRWSFGLSFFIFVLIGMQTTNEEDTVYSEAQAVKINRTVLIYLATMLACVLPALSMFFEYDLIGIFACIAVALLIGFATYKIIKSGKTIKWLRKFYKTSTLFALAFVMTIGYSLIFYSWYISQHVTGVEKYNSLVSQEEEYVHGLNQNEYFRTDSACEDTWGKSFENRGVNNEYYSTRSYNSISNKYVYEFLKENGVYNPTQNLGISGLDERYLLQTLLSVKYTYNDKCHQYGFSKVDGFDNLYINDNYLPLGFFTDKTYSRDYYLSLETLERQYILADGVVLDIPEGNKDGTLQSKITKIDLTEGKVSYTLKANDKLTYKSGSHSANEVYLVVHDVENVDGTTKIDVKVNGRTKQYCYSPVGDLMYSEQRTFYLNCGTLESTTDSFEFEISLASGKSFTCSKIEIVSLPFATAKQSLEYLKSTAHLENLTVNPNGVKGSITAPKDGYMLLSLPYTEGFKAYVDGKEEQILRADTAFMAIELTKGTHEVEFVYQTPYLSLGKKVSLFAVIILALVVICDTVWRIIKTKAKSQCMTDKN